MTDSYQNSSGDGPLPSALRGRGVQGNPRNRFEMMETVSDFEHRAPARSVPTRFYRDSTESIIARNNSPDLGFDKSINPYRGCEHGCVYCYARPTHEFLGMSAGLDFESKIMFKECAPSLLARELAAPQWKPEVLAMSGVTDPYQPIERKLRITRGCLEVLVRHRNPVSIITKNSLVTRDRDLIAQLAAVGAASVCLSITTLDPRLTARMEPRTASPQRKLDAIGKLAHAGIPVGVNVAPIIPGLNDEEVPAILCAAREAGASFAGYTLIRLPYAVKDLFLTWLNQEFPGRREKIESRIRDLRDGNLNSSRFGERMRGSGTWGSHIRNLFQLGLRKAGLDNLTITLSVDHFRPSGGRQMSLF